VGLVAAAGGSLLLLIIGEGKGGLPLLPGAFLAAGEGGDAAGGQAGLHVYLGPSVVGMLGAGRDVAQLAQTLPNDGAGFFPSAAVEAGVEVGTWVADASQ
jgi:hypothetical protein